MQEGLRIRSRAPRGGPGGLLLLGLCLAVPALGQNVEDVISAETQGKQESVGSQKRIDAISQETDDLASEYRSILDQTESLRVYNQQLEGLLGSQADELASLQQQIQDVTTVGRGMTPLMLRMLAALEEFVELDVPFLPNERSQRISDLKAMMERADVTDAEKFRRILEAYQVENEYGRTIDAYSSDIEIDGAMRNVDFLRIGRVALVYMTPDESQVGAWDTRTSAWTELNPREYARSIRKGLKMARKQTAPDLIAIPVPDPEEPS
jgi:Protein of unknown function (DUF3450)